MVNNILVQTTKPELAQYLHVTLFSPTTTSLLKVIKIHLLKTWPGLTEGLIKNNYEKLINTTMRLLHMIRQGPQLTRKKPLDTDLEEKHKTNTVYFTNVGPSTMKEGKFYSNLCGHFPITANKVNKYIYLMYVYDCNSILATAMKNRSDREMIRAFTSFTTDLRSRGINPRLHFMDNEASTELKMAMTTIYINYQLFNTSNHRENNSERAIQTFKNHFIAVLCILDKYSHLQLWEILLQQEKINLNLLRQ